MSLILCRYGELWLKSPPVKSRFYSRLISNMHRMLAREGIGFKIIRKRNRVFVETDQPERSMSVLKDVIGLHSISPVERMEMDHDSVSGRLLEIAQDKLDDRDKTFAVRVKRTGKHEITSKEMESRWGYDIGKKFGNPVDLTSPDVTFHIEVREDTAYVFTDIFPCRGGLPVGVEGTVAARIDTTDDLVAAYMIMCRGCDIIAITRNSALAERLSRYSPDLLVMGYDDLISSVRISIEEHNAKAFVVGERLDCMTDLENDLEVPILRPLVGLDSKMFDLFEKQIDGYIG